MQYLHIQHTTFSPTVDGTSSSAGYLNTDISTVESLNIETAAFIAEDVGFTWK